MIGDDRQHLGGGARQLVRIVAFAAEEMREVGGGLEMPMAAAFDQFDAAARVARSNRLDNRPHLPRRHFVAQPPRNLARVERCVAGEQHRFDRAFQIVDHAGCCPMGAAFR